MAHFACTGSCGGESNNEGVCEAEFCSKESQPLVPCNCEDGMHKDAGEKTAETEGSIY
ncbi:MAG: hypothetical protein AAB511_00215 [Patescibacteria group bacterium]